jgi:hypothetical protein
MGFVPAAIGLLSSSRDNRAAQRCIGRDQSFQQIQRRAVELVLLRDCGFDRVRGKSAHNLVDPHPHALIGRASDQGWPWLNYVLLAENRQQTLKLKLRKRGLGSGVALRAPGRFVDLPLKLVDLNDLSHDLRSEG